MGVFMKICSWNVNSIRLRELQILKVLKEHCPDVICLQECKAPIEKFPTQGFHNLGYEYMIGRGQKGYNGVAIFSKTPIIDEFSIDFADLKHARHIAGHLKNGLVIHNFYVPAGGDEPNIVNNAKFAQKLAFLDAMKNWFDVNKPKRAILVGDLNIAPNEDDVWDHKKLSKIVSHTPLEIEKLSEVMKSGHWIDVFRKTMPDGKLYSWWSYRAKDWQLADKGRRLDRIWVSSDLSGLDFKNSIFRDARGWERPSDHAPIFTVFDET